MTCPDIDVDVDVDVDIDVDVDVDVDVEVLVKLDNFFDLPCLNVMWSLVASGRFSLDIFASPKMIHSIFD